MRHQILYSTKKSRYGKKPSPYPPNSCIFLFYFSLSEKTAVISVII